MLGEILRFGWDWAPRPPVPMVGPAAPPGANGPAAAPGASGQARFVGHCEAS